MKAVREMKNSDIDLLRPGHVEAAAARSACKANIRIIEFLRQRQRELYATLCKAFKPEFSCDQSHFLRLSPTAMYQLDASFRTTFVSDGAVPNCL